jgi:hypothetical protein
MLPVYLIVWVDYRVRPPVVVTAGLYMEEHPSATMHLIPHCVDKFDADTEEWAEAVDYAIGEMAKTAEFHPMHAWALEFFDKLGA